MYRHDNDRQGGITRPETSPMHSWKLEASIERQGTVLRRRYLLIGDQTNLRCEICQELKNHREWSCNMGSRGSVRLEASSTHGLACARQLRSMQSLRNALPFTLAPLQPFSQTPTLSSIVTSNTPTITFPSHHHPIPRPHPQAPLSSTPDMFL